MWAALGAAVISGLASRSAARSSEKKDKAQIELEGLMDRKHTKYQLGLQEFYKQRDRAEKRNAFTNYTKFGNLSSFAPGYSNTATPTVPVEPDVKG